MGAAKKEMGSSHTPGPWTATPVGTPARHWLVEIPGINREMVGDQIVVGADGGPDEVVAIDAANARLVAAAPELLDALQSLLWQVDGRPDGETHIVTAAARAAIAKARGES